MGAHQLKELIRFRKENERLRKVVSDRMFDKLILAAAEMGNF